MRRRPLHLLLPALLLASCLGSDTPTGVGELAVRIPINPALIPSPADGGAAPIHRIRASAVRAGDNAVLGQTTMDVSPTADEWEIILDVTLGQPSADVLVTVLLLNVSGGQESVQFSGRVGPLAINRGEPVSLTDIPIVRGPVANLFVTGVTILSTPDTLLEGASALLQGEATTSASGAPRVFWTSLDPTLLGTVDSTVTALLPGTGRVVASAGAHTDTASIVVRAAPASISVSPASDTASAIGEQLQYQAAVLDARGDTIGLEQVTWRSATPQVVASLGGGLFEAVAAGDGTVEAVSLTAPNVVGSAEMIVLDGGSGPSVDVEVRKTVDEPQPLADSQVTFTVSVVNNGPVDVTGLAVFDTLAAVFLSPSHAVTAGSLVGDSLWTIPSLAQGDTARWTTTVTVAPDAGGGSASNRAVLRAVAQNDSTPTNDTASVALTFPLSAVPVVQISQPADGAVFDPGDPVTFTGAATDAEDGDLSPQIQWTSSVDGPIGTGRSFSTSTMSTGVHTIAATATDSDGGTGADTITVTIALITTPATLNVPYGGTASLPITLSEPAQTGGVTLSVASADQSITTPASSTVFIPGGAFSANATLSGLQPGTTDVTVSHPQFGASVTTVSVTAALNVVQPSLTVPQTLPQAIDIRLESQGTPIAAPAGGLAVTLTPVDPTCVGAPSSVTIPAGLVSQTATLSYAGSAQTPCTSWVRVTAPSIAPDSLNVTVSVTPSISVSSTTVGAGLQYGYFNAVLGATQHGGVTLRIESSDPSLVLVSADAATQGADFIDIIVPNGQNVASYYVHGLEGVTGAAQLLVSAPGFVSNNNATITVVQSAFDISGLSTSLNTFSPEQPFQVRVGIPNGQLTGLSALQAVRVGGSTLTATITSSNTQAGDLVTLPDSTSPVTVDIAPGAATSSGTVVSGGVAFNAANAGTTTVRATINGLVSTANASRDVTISAPSISVSSTTVGAGLQYGYFNAVLGATQHGGVTLRIESSDPSLVLVSADAATQGADFIDIIVPNGQNVASYYVHGLEGVTGAAQLLVSAPGFVSNNNATVDVVQPAFDITGPSTALNTFSPDQPFQVRVGIPNGQLTGLSALQAVRIGGSTLTATITSSNTQAGILLTSGDSGGSVTVDIAPGAANSPMTVGNGGVAFNSLGIGTTTVGATINGLTATTNASRDVTISAPVISMTSTTVGAGLQYGYFNAVLGASQHNGVTVRLRSSNPNVFLVSPDASTQGSEFIDVFVPNGGNVASYYVHGLEAASGTATLTATAQGFTDGSATVTVAQPALDMSGLSTTHSASGSDQTFQVRVGLANAQQTGLTVLQAVRIGGATLQAAIESSVPGAGRLVTTSATGGSVTVQIVPGVASSPTTVAGGGVAFDPVAAGSTTVTATIPGVVTTSNGTRTVTINP